jgi:hypothetical protein
MKLLHCGDFRALDSTTVELSCATRRMVIFIVAFESRRHTDPATGSSYRTLLFETGNPTRQLYSQRRAKREMQSRRAGAGPRVVDTDTERQVNRTVAKRFVARSYRSKGEKNG